MVRKLSLIGAMFVVSAVLLVAAVVPQNAEAQRKPKPEPEKVTICHFRNNVKRPYGPRAIEVSKKAVDGQGKNDHTSHTGPVAYSPEFAQELKDSKIFWGDIIPPFDDFAGQNWTEWGQAMWENNCQYVEQMNFFQFAKVWDGDAIDVEGVDVTFYIGETAWQLGDDAVPVELGQELSPLSEKVDGLPEDCSYESDLPSSYTVPGAVEMNALAVDIDEPPLSQTFTLTATNTVDCDDEEVPEEPEEPGQVLGDTDEPQVTVTPTGAVSAGGGGAAATSSLALAGLLGSIAATGFGFYRFKELL